MVRYLTVAFLWGALFALLLVATAHAADAGYPTEGDAARAAVSASISASREWEYGGGIYVLGGAYYFTEPVTSGSDRELASYKLRLPAHATLVALYHTHPGASYFASDTSEKFSGADIRTANAMHVASYVGVVKSGAVIMYRPKSAPNTAALAESTSTVGNEK